MSISSFLQRQATLQRLSQKSNLVDMAIVFLFFFYKCCSQIFTNNYLTLPDRVDCPGLSGVVMRTPIRVLRSRIGERPPDMEVSCDIFK